MSSITEKGSLALSALNITNFNKSISDEILLDKETGLFYYNIKDDLDENIIKNTVSVDIMNRISNSINRIENMINKNGGSDYKIFTLSDSNGNEIKPFLFKDNKVVNIDNLVIEPNEIIGKNNIMIFIDSSMVVKFVDKIDIQQIPVVTNIKVNAGNADVIKTCDIDGFNIYNLNDLINNTITITFMNNFHKNSHIIVYGVYFVIM